MTMELWPTFSVIFSVASRTNELTATLTSPLITAVTFFSRSALTLPLTVIS